MARTKTTNGSTTGANLGFEAKLWAMADELRGSMDSGEYKHVVLGLIFLKYISDRFERRHVQLVEGMADPDNLNYISEPDERRYAIEDRDYYTADNVFWVPKEARWPQLQAMAHQPEIGKAIDDAMAAIEHENPKLKGVLPKDYARTGVDKERLGRLIDIVATVNLSEKDDKSKDIVGRVYEYFLKQFAAAEGKKGGEFYTPRCVVQTLVEMLAPYKGRVYDPCCGSGGMFVQSEEFIDAHGRTGDISIWGQELNYTTWRLARMNLAIRGIEADLGQQNADSFLHDLHPDLKADYILANPPFNMSPWGGDRLKTDPRWQYGMPPEGNANYAWIQHFIYHLAPHGEAGFLLANGSMASNTSGEGEIRRHLIEADVVDCMVAMPGQLFYSTQIPVCLWFLTRFKGSNRFHDRRGHILFIDARKLGTMVDRTHKELSPEDIQRIAGTYHAWRGDPNAGEYEDAAGFCKSATLDEVAANGYVLTPGRYVGVEEVDDEGEPFDEKMKRLTADLGQQMQESSRLDDEIRKNLKGLGYGT
jgi:type I restriction enzyme M protein